MRHRSEQFRRRDGRHRQRAAHPADDRDYPGDDASGDAAAAHNLAGKHEERHREQRKIVEAAEHIGLNRLHRHMRDQQIAASEVSTRTTKIGKPRTSKTPGKMK